MWKQAYVIYIDVVQHFPEETDKHKEEHSDGHLETEDFSLRLPKYVTMLNNGQKNLL